MFVFRLQSVLDHRKTREEMALRDFSAAMTKLNADRATEVSLRDKEARLIAEWRELAGQPAKATDFTLYAEYIKGVQHALRDQRAVVAASEAEVEGKRLALVAIVKDRKILETLKEKQRQAYERWLAGRERKAMDEIAILKFKGEKS